MSYRIIPFDQIVDSDRALVGGKAFSLAKLYQQGLPIPSGFVVTNTDPKPITTAEFKKELEAATKQIATSLVAVRSSAEAEDTNTSSWAGQLKTFLGVQKKHLSKYIEACWSSNLTEAAQSYGSRLSVKNSSMGVIVQSMVPSHLSGVLFTKHPVTCEGQLILEVVSGLGEVMVQGLVIPKRYVLNKKNYRVETVTPGDQDTQLVIDGNYIVEQYTTAEITVSEQHLIQLAKYGTQLEAFWKTPQDIEWALTTEKIYILQSRPLTSC